MTLEGSCRSCWADCLVRDLHDCQSRRVSAVGWCGVKGSLWGAAMQHADLLAGQESLHGQPGRLHVQKDRHHEPSEAARHRHEEHCLVGHLASAEVRHGLAELRHCLSCHRELMLSVEIAIII